MKERKKGGSLLNTPSQNKYYYNGIWCSKQWPKAIKLLKRRYTMENIDELFSFNRNIKAANMVKELVGMFGNDLVFNLIFPAIQSVALTSQRIRVKKIPILTQHNREKIVIHKYDCACMFATTFLCMFEDKNEGRPKQLQDLMDREGRCFPSLSFHLYWGSDRSIMIYKTLYYIRYLLKMSIRMALSKHLDYVEHAPYFVSGEELKKHLKLYEGRLESIYDVEKEFILDSAMKPNHLEINLFEFSPHLINPEYKMTIKDEDTIRDEIDGEISSALSSPEHMFHLPNKEEKGVDIIGFFGDKKELKCPRSYEIAKYVFSERRSIIDPEFFRKIVIHKESITKQKDTITTNFANKILGGGCMHGASVQEEILVLVAPEIMIARLFVMEMTHTQSIGVGGYEIFSLSKGYGSSLSYGGVYIDDVFYPQEETRGHYMVAVDAIPMGWNWEVQFCPTMIFRELVKFSTAVQDPESHLGLKIIATGNWGCGVFGGNVWLKFLIQMVACIFCGMRLNFSCFGDDEEKRKIEEFVEKMIDLVETKETSMGMLFASLINMDLNQEDVSGNKVLDVYLKTLRNLK